MNLLVSVGAEALVLISGVALFIVGTGIAIGLYGLTEKRRAQSGRQADGGRHSTIFRTLLTLLGVGIAVPVFLVLLYLQHGDGRRTTDASPSVSGSAEPTVAEQEHLHRDVPTGTPDSPSKPICETSAAPDDLPAWVCHPETHDGKRTLVVIVGEQFVTTEEAERNALQQAEQRLRDDFEREYPTDIAWNIPRELVQAPVLTRNRFLRRIERTSGETAFQVRQMILQLELSPEGRNLIYPVWRRQVVGHRLWSLGGVLLLLTGILVTMTLYFRLDARTGGQCRVRLKLAAVFAIVAFGILIETSSPLVERFVSDHFGQVPVEQTASRG